MTIFYAMIRLLNILENPDDSQQFFENNEKNKEAYRLYKTNLEEYN